jgi:hypothetical protein
MLAEGVRSSEIFRHFDITAENVKKVFKEHIKNNLAKYLPNWPSRMTK